MNYQEIFSLKEANTSLQRIKPFVPQMFDCQTEHEPYTITLENLLFGKENASFVDVKLGTSTVTLDAQKRGTLIVKAREFTDYGRTSA